MNNNIIKINNSNIYYDNSKVIGKGSFCTVYNGYKKHNGNIISKLAVKVEKKSKLNTLL